MKPFWDRYVLPNGPFPTVQVFWLCKIFPGVLQCWATELFTTTFPLALLGFLSPLCKLSGFGTHTWPENHRLASTSLWQHCVAFLHQAWYLLILYTGEAYFCLPSKVMAVLLAADVSWAFRWYLFPFCVQSRFPVISSLVASPHWVNCGPLQFFSLSGLRADRQQELRTTVKINLKWIW